MLTSGKSLPSLKELFAIIKYFGITPSEFFEKKYRHPDLVNKVINGMSELTDDDIKIILGVIRKIGLLRGIVKDLSSNQENTPVYDK